MGRISLFLFLFTLWGAGLYAQSPVGVDSVFFSGVVLDASNVRPLESVTCRYGNLGTLTNSKGQFIIRVSQGDTITFTYVGFKPYCLVIPDSLRDPEYIMGVFMSPDTVRLSEVLILRRFIDTKRQQLISLKNNMSGVLSRAYAPVEEMDAEMNQRMNIDQFARTIEMKGHVDVGLGVGTQSVDALNLLRLRKKMNEKDRIWLNYEEIDLLRNLYYLEKRENRTK